MDEEESESLSRHEHWLTNAGRLRVPSRPFGEGGYPMHTFIHLCSELQGAEDAAHKAFSEASRRLNKGDLKQDDFCFDGIYFTPDKYVYEVEIQDSARRIDLFATELDVKSTLRIYQCLLKLAWRGSPINLWRLLRIYGQFRCSPGMIDNWIRESLENTCGLNGGDQQVVELLTEAGFDLIENIHSGSSSNYDVVYALIIRSEHSTQAGTPVAIRVVWP